LSHYFPFFLFGYAAQRRPSLWSRFGETKSFYLIGNGGLLVTGLLSFSDSTRISIYSEMVRDNLAAFVLIGLTIRFARRILDRESLPLLGSPDIAYSVYLVHHVIIIGVAVVLVRFAMPPLVKFVAITCLAAALSLAAASVIRRYSVLRFLFNGRPMGA
jgi:glucan biosynthesis protein C